jgi:hypothetical protein
MGDEEMRHKALLSFLTGVIFLTVQYTTTFIHFSERNVRAIAAEDHVLSNHDILMMDSVDEANPTPIITPYPIYIMRGSKGIRSHHWLKASGIEDLADVRMENLDPRRRMESNVERDRLSLALNGETFGEFELQWMEDVVGTFRVSVVPQTSTKKTGLSPLHFREKMQKILALAEAEDPEVEAKDPEAEAEETEAEETEVEAKDPEAEETKAEDPEVEAKDPEAEAEATAQEEKSGSAILNMVLQFREVLHLAPTRDALIRAFNDVIYTIDAHLGFEKKNAQLQNGIKEMAQMVFVELAHLLVPSAYYDDTVEASIDPVFGYDAKDVFLDIKSSIQSYYQILEEANLYFDFDKPMIIEWMEPITAIKSNIEFPYDFYREIFETELFSKLILKNLHATIPFTKETLDRYTIGTLPQNIRVETSKTDEGTWLDLWMDEQKVDLGSVRLGIYKGYTQSVNQEVVSLEVKIKRAGGSLKAQMLKAGIEEELEVFYVPLTRTLRIGKTNADGIPWFLGTVHENQTITGDYYKASSSIHMPSAKDRLGGFQMAYTDLLLYAQNIDITPGEHQIRVRNWKQKSTINDPNGDARISFQRIWASHNSPMTLSLDTQGNLLLDYRGPMGSEFWYRARLQQTGETMAFRIRFLEDQEESILDAVDFETSLRNILRHPDRGHMLYLFEGLMEKAPNDPLRVDSLERLFRELNNSGALDVANDEWIYWLKVMASKVNEIISTVKIPSYYMGGKVVSFVGPMVIQEYETRRSGIQTASDAINKILNNTTDWLFQVERILVLDGLSPWKERDHSMEMPYGFHNQIFRDEFYSQLLKTQNATLVMRDNTFGQRDLSQSFNINQRNDLFFHATRHEEGDLELKLFLDDKGIHQFVDYVSVQAPIPSFSSGTSHQWTTFFKDPKTGNENVSGMVNPITKQMIFNTNHFSVFFLQRTQALFNDINEAPTAWAKMFIEALASKGVVAGGDANAFQPSSFIQRKDAAVMIANAFKLIDPKAEGPFTDVQVEDYFYPHVSTMYQYGIVRGSEGEFRPHDFISKQDLLVVLAQAILYRHRQTIRPIENPSDYLRRFQDRRDIARYAQRHFAMMIALGIVKGSDGYAYPQKNVSRAEMAAMVYQAMNVQAVQGLPYDVPMDFVNLN